MTFSHPSHSGFNPRLHVGGDVKGGKIKRIKIYCFNPRLHVGGDSLEASILGRRTCFNPRLHVGGDFWHLRLINIFRVSIHASTWEATTFISFILLCASVSIHASTWEAT